VFQCSLARARFLPHLAPKEMSQDSLDALARGVTVDKNGVVYVCDSHMINYRLQLFCSII
jgi:hypothetical protein